MTVYSLQSEYVANDPRSVKCVQIIVYRTIEWDMSSSVSHGISVHILATGIPLVHLHLVLNKIII